MKKLLILVIAFLLFSSTAWAIPIVQLTDTINDNNRTHFVGFEGIIDSPILTNKISPFPYVESGIKVEQVAYLGTPNNVDSITVNYTSWRAGQRKGGEFHIEEIGL